MQVANGCPNGESHGSTFHFEQTKGDFDAQFQQFSSWKLVKLVTQQEHPHAYQQPDFLPHITGTVTPVTPVSPGRDLLVLPCQVQPPTTWTSVAIHHKMRAFWNHKISSQSDLTQDTNIFVSFELMFELKKHETSRECHVDSQDDRIFHCPRSCACSGCWGGYISTMHTSTTHLTSA